MDYLPFKDISYAQGQWDMDTDTDPAVAMKASGFYTGSKLPYLDDQLVRNYADAIRLGKVPIMYHFAGGSDVATEAAYFIAAIHPLAEGDCYALDWEIEVDDPVGWCLTFLTKVHDATGVWPWIYMDRDRRGRFDWSSVLAVSGLWIAAPDVSFDDDIPGVGVYIAQQGPIVNGVDTDAAFMTLAQLKDYAYHAPNEPQPSPESQPEPTPAPAPTSEPVPSPEAAPTPPVPTGTSTEPPITTGPPSPTIPTTPVVVSPSKPSFFQELWTWLLSLIGVEK